MRWSVACCFFLACATPPESSGTPGAAPVAGSPAPIAVPPPPAAPEIPEVRAAFYATVFPAAKRMVARPIPSEMLLSADKGNDSYVRVLDAGGELLGYLRDFSGPVIPGRMSNPYPIAVLLAFDADLELRTIVPSEPLRKSESTALSESELAKLIEIARKPQPALAEYPRTNDAVDATTEATRPALSEAVVPDFAYTTHRIVNLVKSTRELIEKAPAAWDRKRLQQVVSAPSNDRLLARALAELLGTLETAAARTAVYEMMSRSYALAQKSGAPPDSAVETLVLDPPLAAEVANTEIARACYHLARRDLRPALVDRCVARVSSPSRHPGEITAVARLVGTQRYLRGSVASAFELLATAADAYDHIRDPELHLRLVLAARAAGTGKTACPNAKTLYRDHPLLPGVEKALEACKADVEVLKRKIRERAKAALLAERRSGSKPAPVLSLEGENFQTVELNPAHAGSVTVLVFFSTWCPHCAAELPRVNDFIEAAQAESKMQGRVRVFGVRTSVEKERIPYEQFLAQTKPKFPIYMDATFSLVFGQFVRTQGLQPELPTLAVLDPKGVLRFVLESGDYRDTKQELMWAVEALLP